MDKMTEASRSWLRDVFGSRERQGGNLRLRRPALETQTYTGGVSCLQEIRMA